MKLVFLDVKKMRLKGKLLDDEWTDVELPGGAGGGVGRLRRCLYGMRPTANAWEGERERERERERVRESTWLQCSHKAFENPHGMTLKLVYRAENRCNSSGASAGAFPKPPGAGLDREAAKNQ